MTRPRPATLIEVARRAGVSLTTASKAINGKNRVSDETRARVMAAARELSFTPSPIARGLTTGRTSTVGVIIADNMSYRFAVPVMLGAEAALSEIDLSMIACDAGQRETRGDGLLGKFRGSRVRAGFESLPAQLGLLDSRHQTSVFQDGGRGVAQNAADSQNDHLGFWPPC